MFFRANETSTGSGLGLYIVKETIAKLSGSIQLESSPGVGSVFTVKLPG
jgi:signal transduction histidine kinase